MASKNLIATFFVSFPKNFLTRTWEVIVMVVKVNVIAERIIRAMEQHNKKTNG